MKGRTSFRSHGVALAEQYVKALEGGLKEKILLTWNGTFLMICGNKEGGLRKKAHMEWHFLRLVLALLPEGVLAVVSHNFVLETRI